MALHHRHSQAGNDGNEGKTLKQQRLILLPAFMFAVLNWEEPHCSEWPSKKTICAALLHFLLCICCRLPWQHWENRYAHAVLHFHTILLSFRFATMSISVLNIYPSSNILFASAFNNVSQQQRPLGRNRQRRVCSFFLHLSSSAQRKCRIKV